ncbi:acyl-CoA dehydrogenase [Azoarcus sp. TTM-91]|uniref:acyl-CoA dehydrogenase family protein n=1 Tax=Azoarcus sp. TTM-91 TaxID=2691581 RepID=UPI00145CD69E|nr:acyl-CoA dehydrogenase family protein [Azoarcus sp. TTM-91]NMG36062.1 acyl-CoA dehydrogenase [Azoarcus sp. TTM-91]
MSAALNWFAEQAEALDRDDSHAEALVPELASRGLFRIGVPQALGGSGGDTYDAVEAIAAVAGQSLTAAFVFWGQRTFIEFLLQTPNEALRERLPPLLAGEHAGATGLSNAMKFLSGIESLQIAATPDGEGWRLNGRLPWVTNLRRAGFTVAAAVQTPDGGAAVVALDHDQPGLARSADLDLIALRGSNTAAISVADVAIDSSRLLHADARSFCPGVRPAFLGLQLGMSLGVARRALAQARQEGQGAHAVLLPQIEQTSAELEGIATSLREGLAAKRFQAEPAALFRLRIRLAELAQAAVGLELSASGGRAYLADQDKGFPRRWREAAFIPVVTPSLSQLQGELAKHANR